MPRRKLTSTTSKLNQGRGKGDGPNYKPFLTVRDVPSKGVVHRIKGHKTNRVHHLLSTLEGNCNYILLWSSKVIDIKEQFPIPLDRTMSIAKRLRIHHPIDPHTKQLKVVTIDFIVTVLEDGETVIKARAGKYSADLADKRAIEKLEIERTFCNEERIDYGVFTEKEIVNNLCENIKLIYTANDISAIPHIKDERILQIKTLLTIIATNDGNSPLSHTALEVDSRLGLEPGTTLWVIKHLIRTRQWRIDMLKAFDPSLPFFSVIKSQK